MECRHPHAPRVVPHEGTRAFAHLSGRLVRERDREDLPRPRSTRGQQVGDAVREDARLAGTRARQDQQRPVCGKYRVPLHRVQLSELRLNILFAQRKELCFKLGFHCFPPLVVFWRILFMRTIVFSIAYLHLIEKKKPLPKERLFP